MSENEWMKLPTNPCPAFLPKGTIVRHPEGTFRAEREAELCSQWSYICDWFVGPGRPSGYLSCASGLGMAWDEGVFVQLPQGYRFEGNQLARVCAGCAITMNHDAPERCEDCTADGLDRPNIVFEERTVVLEGEIKEVTIALDTRPLCLSCERPMDERSDGSQLCSAACVQASQREEREKAATVRHEASERAYRYGHRFGSESFNATELDERIADAVNAERAARVFWPERPPAEVYASWPVLNPAALPGVAGIRGKRRAKTDAPKAWPEGAGDDYEL
jgi:hypothetical protein